MTPDALADFKILQSTQFFKDAIDRGDIVQTHIEDDSLSHETIPWISYPYEWSFSMLQDAALLTLNLLEKSLAENITLQDGSAYNVQWKGAQPVFIDIGSFRPRKEGEPWVGYHQFCDLFLHPLLIQALSNLNFHPWLRGSLEGISAKDCWAMLPWVHRLRPTLLTHVQLHARLQDTWANSSRAMHEDLKVARLPKTVILSMARRMRTLISSLSWTKKASEWSDYTTICNYTSESYETKRSFVIQQLARKPRKLVWDIGCNSGDFSRLAASQAEQVISFDADAWVIEVLYKEIRREGIRNILPLYMNLADPSPDLGWRGLERKSIDHRAAPDMILCLALLHHLVIGNNLPMGDVLHWFSQFRCEVVIEFVDRRDSMVQKLLRNKDIRHESYTQDLFESELTRYFDLVDKKIINATRTIYAASPKTS